MFARYTGLKIILPIFISFLLTNCGSDTESKISPPTHSVDDVSYKGLVFYHDNLSTSQYTLNTLSDTTFNALSIVNKRQVADKLLSTLFFGYPPKVLEEKIASGTFISDTFQALSEEKTDKAWLEEHILDENIYERNTWDEQVAVDILTRFYAMKDLDAYFIQNWTAYILTQTIMFSPAYELESTHTPNIARVYNRIVSMLKEKSGMRYITYVHMMSEDNWRRFRSPEDNGREMLEIFTLDMDDSNVPLAAKALKNWKLDKESDTLVVSLNQNRKPVNLFSTTVTNGDDFYREMVKSKHFTLGAITRLVDFFFPTKVATKKTQIINTIIASKPETWQDILLQIVFSQEYLLHSTSPKSAEELFFSTTKKVNFKHRKSSMHSFKRSLENMHQASMKYKLGKRNRVPLDTLSFANYHKFIRESVLLRKSEPKEINNYMAWDRAGWDESFIANENFSFDEKDVVGSLDALVQYLFHTMIARNATVEELSFFRKHMLEGKVGSQKLYSTFNMFRTNTDATKQKEKRESLKRNIAIIVLDYISRLSETYTYKEVK